MPWRVGPDDRRIGVQPDPYSVWLSEIMLQQTTVAAVKPYFESFTARWPSVGDLASARDEDVMAAWAGLGYYARARNLLKCARVVAGEMDGEFPKSRDDLQKLPGIGPYTSAAIAAIAYDEPAAVVDGNVERVMARYFAMTTPLPDVKPEMRNAAESLTPDIRAGDYAQAVMDLGATICTPRNPACGICPLIDDCRGRALGVAVELPVKPPKAPKPVRFGTAYLALRDDGAWLLERRPEKGLLGGMLGWPGSEWSETPPSADPPIDAEWHDLEEEVRHTFTHFHLRLSLRIAKVSDVDPSKGHFLTKDVFSPADLPTVMRKAFDLARGALS